MICTLDDLGQVLDVEKIESYKGIMHSNVYRRFDINFDDNFKEFINRYYSTAKKEEFEYFVSCLPESTLTKFFKLAYVPK